MNQEEFCKIEGDTMRERQGSWHWFHSQSRGRECGVSAGAGGVELALGRATFTGLLGSWRFWFHILFGFGDCTLRDGFLLKRRVLCEGAQEQALPRAAV